MKCVYASEFYIILGYVSFTFVKNCSTLKMYPLPWRRERLPTPVFWPGEFHGLYSPWDRKESDMTEQLSLSL